MCAGMVYPEIRLCVCVSAHVCTSVCVHEGVRLIEVVRVKMIPSGWGVGA